MIKIKFRGRAACNCEDMDGEIIAEKGDWIQGYLCGGYIIGDVVDACDEYFAPDFWIPVDPKTVGQYTGKSVLTGEVYEGDIATSIDGTFLVTWDEEKAAFVMQFYTYPNECLCLEEMWENSKVIGNLYDNPELLEETK